MSGRRVRGITAATIVASALLAVGATSANARVIGTMGYVNGNAASFSTYPQSTWSYGQFHGNDCVLFDRESEMHAWARADRRRKFLVRTLGWAACAGGGRGHVYAR